MATITMDKVRERRGIAPDAFLFNITLLLLIVGVVAVYDASYARTLDLKGMGNDGYFFLKRQALFLGLGLLAMYAASRVGYWRLRKIAGPLLVTSLVLLILVWAPAIGITKNHAARWVGHGQFQVQPSEIAKLALIIYLAALLSRASLNIRSFSDGLLVPIAVVGIFVMLIEREPDLGTAAIVFLTCITLLYLAGARLRHLAGICAAGLALALLVSVIGHGFRHGRLTTFMNPEGDYYGKGYQLIHGKIAVGSGGLGGVGLGSGREKFYLPEANTDFIFATIAEETGLWGSLLTVSLLFLLGYQGFTIARRTRDPFGAMLAAGIAAMISWQAVINVAVVTGSIPATGVPLPFVSYGGSSLVLLLIAIGILLNISRHPDAPSRESGSAVPAAT